MPLLNPISKSLDGEYQASIGKCYGKFIEPIISIAVLILASIEILSFMMCKNGGEDIVLSLWGSAQTYAAIQLFVVGVILVVKSFYFSTRLITKIATISFFAAQAISCIYLFTGLDWEIYSFIWFAIISFGAIILSLIATFTLLWNANYGNME